MRVFSKKKFLENEEYRKMYYETILPLVGDDNWVNHFNGKSETQMKKEGYWIIEEAMVEK